MPSTTLTMPPDYNSRKPKYRMLIKTIDGKITFGALFAPREIEYANFGRTWSTVARSGRVPLLVHEANKLPTMSFTMMIAKARDPLASVQPHLDALRKLSETGTPLKIIYGGGFDNFTWRLTDFTANSKQRHPSTSAITAAEVNLTFTVVSDIKTSTGPVTGGVKPSSTSGTSKSKSATISQKTTSSKKVRYYTFKKGDTLYSLAIKFYGDASKWRRLADMNNIKNPRTIPVGKKIKY